MCTHVSAPPFIPFIIAISLFIGAPFVHGETNFLKSELNFDLVKANLLQYIIGTMILAVSASLILGTLSYFIFEKLSPSKSKKI